MGWLVGKHCFSHKYNSRKRERRSGTIYSQTLLLLLFGLWVIADRLEPCVVPTRRCRSLTVTADLRSWAPSYKTRPTYYLSARPDGR